MTFGMIIDWTISGWFKPEKYQTRPGGMHKLMEIFGCQALQVVFGAQLVLGHKRGCSPCLDMIATTKSSHRFGQNKWTLFTKDGMIKPTYASGAVAIKLSFGLGLYPLIVFPSLGLSRVSLSKLDLYTFSDFMYGAQMAI